MLGTSKFASHFLLQATSTAILTSAGNHQVQFLLCHHDCCRFSCTRRSPSRARNLLTRQKKFIDSACAAYEPVDRNFDAIELTAECSIAYVDMMAAELQVRALRKALRARSQPLQRIASRLQPVVSVSCCRFVSLVFSICFI
jgi:hypothetical protein